MGTSTYNFCRSFLTLHYFLNLGACKRFASFASAVAGAPNKTTNVGVAGAGWGWGREMAGTGGGVGQDRGPAENRRILSRKIKFRIGEAF